MIPSQVHQEHKIFVTGIYGSGKTTYAKEYAKLTGFKYIDFDMYFNYAKTLSVLKHASDMHFINILSDNFITDAIPWNPDTGSVDYFKQYARSTDVKIVCCVCPCKITWAHRIQVCKGLEMSPDRYKHYAEYYKKTLPQYFEFDISCYDSVANAYITKEQLYERIAWSNGYC